MARKVYIGNNNVARNVKKIYVGVNGVARKVKKGYIGDSSGKARLFFSGATRWNRYNIKTSTVYVWNQYTLIQEAQYDYYEKDNNISGTITLRGTQNIYRWPEFNKRTGYYENGRARSVYDCYRNEDLLTWSTTSPTSKTQYQFSRIDRLWDDTAASDEADRYELWYSQYWTIEQEFDRYVYSQGSYIGQVTSASSDTYPDDDYTGNYWYVSNGTKQEQSQGSFIDTVESDNPNAYPDNGISGNYWYTKIS